MEVTFSSQLFLQRSQDSVKNQLFTSYGVTILITVVGTFTGLLVMSMMAFALSRKDFRIRKVWTVILIIPMLFSGGQLSAYLIFTGVYHLKDSLLLLILPLTVSTMNVIILRTYMLCINKYLEGGVENALYDAPGRGRNAEITDDE